MSGEPRGSGDDGSPAPVAGMGARSAVTYGRWAKAVDVVSVVAVLGLLIGAVVSFVERDWFDVAWCLVMGAAITNAHIDRRTARARRVAGPKPSALGDGG